MYYVRERNQFYFILLDIMVFLLTFTFSLSTLSTYNGSGTWLLLVIVVVIVDLLSEENENVDKRGYLLELKYTTLFVVKVVSIFMLILMLVYKKQLFDHIHIPNIAIFSIVSFFAVYVVRMFAKKLWKQTDIQERAIIVIANLKKVDRFLETLPEDASVKAFLDTNYAEDVYNELPVLHSHEEIRSFIATNKIDEIYTNTVSRENVRENLLLFKELGITTKINITPIFEEINADSRLTVENGNSYLTSAIKIATTRQLVMKRMMDIVIALVGLVLTAVVALLIYPIVKKQAPGPLIFKQTRIGERGEKFQIYKFRSMYVDAEERKQELLSQNEHSSDLMFKMENDPRIFPFGHKMRKWSIDELPQFINVLKGEMSAVGTRPPTVDEYEKYDLHHFKRMQVKPGVTGLWQVSGRSNITDFEEVVKLDMEYIENWSIRLDIKIIVKTLLVVLKHEGSK